MSTAPTGGAYPECGNYWSDYTGPDSKSGPSQNLPGSDGIGDIPYVIEGLAKSVDWYPFMSENGWLIPRTPIHYSTYTEIAPTMDGILSPGEWLNPIKITLNGFSNSENTKEGILYVMNDNWNIYIAAIIPDSRQDADYLMLKIWVMTAMQRMAMKMLVDSM